MRDLFLLLIVVYQTRNLLGAPHGTCLTFATAGGKLAVSVNDQPVGTISSSSLATAFQGIYCDGKAVCEMKPVAEATGDVKAQKGLITPERGAAVGALLGYTIGRIFS